MDLALVSSILGSLEEAVHQCATYHEFYNTPAILKTGDVDVNKNIADCSWVVLQFFRFILLET